MLANKRKARKWFVFPFFFIAWTFICVNSIFVCLVRFVVVVISFRAHFMIIIFLKYLWTSNIMQMKLNEHTHWTENNNSNQIEMRKWQNSTNDLLCMQCHFKRNFYLLLFYLCSWTQFCSHIQWFFLFLLPFFHFCFLTLSCCYAFIYSIILSWFILSTFWVLLTSCH